MPGGLGGGAALERGGREPLHEDGAQELQRRRVAGGGRHRFDRHAERPDRLYEATRASTRGKRRRSQAAGGHGPQQRDVREARLADELREPVLQGRSGRVEVGVDRVLPERPRGCRGDTRGDRSGVDAQDDLASGNGRHHIGGPRRASHRVRVVAGDVGACSLEVGGETAPRLAEPEHRDLHALTVRGSTGGVP